MRKIGAFNFISLDGYFQGPDGDTSWHRHGEEENQYAVDALKTEGTLLFGRITYEMMAGFWPTDAAKEMSPGVAEGMNKFEKIVFSNTLKTADWNNSRIISGNIVEEIAKLKQADGNDMMILGSGSIVTQFSDAGLIDEFQIMVDPVALGGGTPIFHGMKKKLDLELVASRTFKSGVVLLTYVPLKNG